MQLAHRDGCPSRVVLVPLPCSAPGWLAGLSWRRLTHRSARPVSAQEEEGGGGTVTASDTGSGSGWWPAPSSPLSPTCRHLKRRHDRDRRKSSFSLSAVQYRNTTAGPGIVLNSPNTYFLMKGFFTLFTQNHSPAFQKQSPSSLLPDVNCSVHVQRK